MPRKNSPTAMSSRDWARSTAAAMPIRPANPSTMPIWIVRAAPTRPATRPAEGRAVSEPTEAANNVRPSSPALRPSSALLSAIREAKVAKATPASANTTKTALRVRTALVRSGARDWVTSKGSLGIGIGDRIVSIESIR